MRSAIIVLIDWLPVCEIAPRRSAQSASRPPNACSVFSLLTPKKRLPAAAVLIPAKWLSRVGAGEVVRCHHKVAYIPVRLRIEMGKLPWNQIILVREFSTKGRRSTPDHEFPEPDRIYEVTLTVTDNDGASESTSCQVKIDQSVPPVTEILHRGYFSFCSCLI